MPEFSTAERTFIAQLCFRTLSASAHLLSCLDFKGLRVLSHGLGAVLWHTLPARRSMASRNIRDHLALPEAESRDIARESFNHNAMSFLEAVLVGRCHFAPPLFLAENPAQLEAIQHSTRPIVTATGHLGAWELLAGIHESLRPAGAHSAVVVRRYNSRPFNDLMMALRGSHGIEVIGHREASGRVLQILRKQGTVAFLVDHHTGSNESTRIEFLGEPATVNIGPAVLAVRGRALIRPLCLIRKGDSYMLRADTPLDTTTLEGSIDARIHAAAIFYTRGIERMIRQTPEQWFWMHNRWKH